ncbi:Protein of unknown function [Nonlabens sp. Hel1_33_55]|uniref:DUF3078 domain-containing protein n=1 Tax=Nonlabens sp. Hel1_33_55 TaxID=1336802 RepID=UPI000875D223|nr:DUF3078 domain-containing protein [Nonlabens sp. Hel1_33_55]SCY31816.1 Protein of unknown function [Nonlabens sp. Hel1_33_55]
MLMKIWMCLLLTLTSITLIKAQDAGDKDVTENGWANTGKFQFLFNQSAFNADWTGGGTSSIAGSLAVDVDLVYTEDRIAWENSISAEYGLTIQEDERFTRKTNDRIELNSVVGYEVRENDDTAYYSFFINAMTQATKGYVYSKNDDGEVTRTERTNMFSPGYFQAGPGFLYKKNKMLTLNVAPSTARLILVDDMFTSGEDYEDGSYFGVDAGETKRYELGASINAMYKFKIMDNITMDNKLLIYSNYLDKPGNVDINYATNINMKVNDYISAKLIFQAIYDDNAVGAFQIREVSGLGLNYTL